jgi:hypothetical protein
MVVRSLKELLKEDFGLTLSEVAHLARLTRLLRLYKRMARPVSTSFGESGSPPTSASTTPLTPCSPADCTSSKESCSTLCCRSRQCAWLACDGCRTHPSPVHITREWASWGPFCVSPCSVHSDGNRLRTESPSSVPMRRSRSLGRGSKHRIGDRV